MSRIDSVIGTVTNLPPLPALRIWRPPRELNTPQPAAPDQLPHLFSCIVDSVGGDQRATAGAMTAPPCYELGDIIVGDVSDQLVLAEKLNQIA
jgi:hypothetical protein